MQEVEWKHRMAFVLLVLFKPTCRPSRSRLRPSCCWWGRRWCGRSQGLRWGRALVWSCHHLSEGSTSGRERGKSSRRRRRRCWCQHWSPAAQLPSCCAPPRPSRGRPARRGRAVGQASWQRQEVKSLIVKMCLSQSWWKVNNCQSSMSTCEPNAATQCCVWSPSRNDKPIKVKLKHGQRTKSGRWNLKLWVDEQITHLTDDNKIFSFQFLKI